VTEHRWLDRAASFSWKYLAVIAAVTVTFYAIGVVKVVVIPLILGLFVAAILSPPVQGSSVAAGRRCSRHGPGSASSSRWWPASRCCWCPPSSRDSVRSETTSVRPSTRSVEWLESGPLQLSAAEIEGYIEDASRRSGRTWAA
jgi:hypothetical protein